MTKYAQQARATKKKRKVFKYDDKKTRGRNVVNRVATAPQTFEAKIRKKERMSKLYQAERKRLRAAGKRPLEIDRMTAPTLSAYMRKKDKAAAGIASRVNKNSKKKNKNKMKGRMK
tara:strand:+ start:535 stop:882 length:348 start_codon:yes stop_codon:yes gene_type:complete